MKFKTSDGYEYRQDEYGIHQLNPQPFLYDETYCAIYDDPEREKKSDVLQSLRLGFVIGAHGGIPNTLLDVGSGNFAFLKTAQKAVPHCYAHDVAVYDTPPGITKVMDIFKPVNVITMHDVLEHLVDPGRIVQQLQCDTLVISLPNRINGTEEKNKFNYLEWFDKEYFHRKPNEHLHHFGPLELVRFMWANGWEKMVSLSQHEDIIRKRGQWNIISAAFKRK